MNAQDRQSLYMTVLMTPDMANFSGNVHGGTLLKLLDQVAYSCASRYAGTYVVTLSVDRVLFRDSIKVGELVSFSASVNHTGRTSLEVGIRVDTEGNPVPVPPLVPATERERNRFYGAVARRAALKAAFAD